MIPRHPMLAQNSCLGSCGKSETDVTQHSKGNTRYRIRALGDPSVRSSATVSLRSRDALR